MSHCYSPLVSFVCFFVSLSPTFGQEPILPKRARDLGVDVGILPVGELNAITDVQGVQVGHQTIVRGQHVRTGVTIILPHGNDLYQHKVPAAIYAANGFGKLAGSTQVAELGNIETPIGLTNLKQDGSCMIVIATNVPLSPRNLKRMAKRSIFGMARTGSIMSNGSGDYAIAFSTAYRHSATDSVRLMPNDEMNPLFLAVIEATEEAIYNSLFAARTSTGRDGHTVASLPVDKAVAVLDKYNLRNLNDCLPLIK